MRLIDANALKEQFDEIVGEYTVSEIQKSIDGAPTISLPNEQISWEQGYEAGLAQGKHDMPQGDLISREALIREIGRTDEWYKGRSICNIIDNAPTVVVDCKNCDGYEAGYSAGVRDTERPKGEWINREAISNTIFPFWERYECNQCHKFNGYSNFCPNCGADMRGKENGMVRNA